MSHVHCPTCGEAYEPVDYPVVWPWPGSCRCSADRQPRGRVAMGERELRKLRGRFAAVSIPEPKLEGGQ